MRGGKTVANAVRGAQVLPQRRQQSRRRAPLYVVEHFESEVRAAESRTRWAVRGVRQPSAEGSSPEALRDSESLFVVNLVRWFCRHRRYVIVGTQEALDERNGFLMASGHAD